MGNGAGVKTPGDGPPGAWATDRMETHRNVATVDIPGDRGAAAEDAGKTGHSPGVGQMQGDNPKGLTGLEELRKQTDPSVQSQLCHLQIHTQTSKVGWHQIEAEPST